MLLKTSAAAYGLFQEIWATLLTRVSQVPFPAIYELSPENITRKGQSIYTLARSLRKMCLSKPFHELGDYRVSSSVSSTHVYATQHSRRNFGERTEKGHAPITSILAWPFSLAIYTNESLDIICSGRIMVQLVGGCWTLKCICQGMCWCAEAADEVLLLGSESFCHDEIIMLEWYMDAGHYRVHFVFVWGGWAYVSKQSLASWCMCR